MQKSNHIKPIFLQILTIFIIGIIIVYPTFDIALTGDDYLGYWRITQALGENPKLQDYVNYFLTDYGPQDTLTYVIHSFAEFNSTYYYTIAFLLRYIASLSFYPVVKLISKNKFSAFTSALFFMLSATGMEVLDWSFNMPSYLGITFMNLWIFFILKSYQKDFFKFTILGYICFILAIISQPIRMLVFPFFAVAVHVLSTFYKYPPTLKKIIIHIILCIFISFVLIKSSQYGVDTSASKSISSFLTVVTQFKLLPLLNPIGIIGNIIIPTSYLPNYIDKLLSKLIYVIPTLIFIIFTVVTRHLNTVSNNKRLLKPFFILGLFWAIISTYLYSPKVGIEILMSDYLGFIIGGFFCIMILQIVSLSKDNVFSLLLAFSMILAFIIPAWFRNPNTMFGTESRYLIISTAGLAMLIGVFCNTLTKNKFAVLSIVALFLFNILSISKYVNHLHASKNKTLADRIRNSIMYDSRVGNNNEPFVYYLEADNPDIYYYSLYFGFPFFLNYYKGEMKNPWLIMYTNDWQEISDAYQTGNSLKRFMNIEIKPVDLTRIYSYKLENGLLLNTTNETREKLRSIDQDKLKNTKSSVE